MKIKKSEITINGVVYCFIKSKDDKGKKNCEQFIRGKKDTLVYWEHKSESTGFQHFYLNGKKHREDGPASIWSSSKWGNGEAWFINDKGLSEEEKKNQIRKINLNKCL